MAEQNDPVTECTCANCTQFGQRVRLIAGPDFQIVVHADGNVAGHEQLSGTPRRKRAQFRIGRNGQLVAASRGERRERDLRDFGYILNQVGPNRRDLPGSFAGVTPSDRRGRPQGRLVNSSEVRRLVGQQRASGATLEASWTLVGSELGWSAETIRKAYFRKDQ